MKHLKVRCSIDKSKRRLTLLGKDLLLIFQLNVSRSPAGWIEVSSAKPVICSAQVGKNVLDLDLPTDVYWALWKSQILQLSERSEGLPGFLLDVPLNVKPFLPSIWKSSQLFLPLTTLEGRTQHVELIMSGTDYHPIDLTFLKDTPSHT